MSAFIPSEKTHTVTLKALARPHATLELRSQCSHSYPSAKWASWQRNSFSSLGSPHSTCTEEFRAGQKRTEVGFLTELSLRTGLKEACAYTKEHRNNFLRRYLWFIQWWKGKIAVSKQKQYPYKNIKHSWEILTDSTDIADEPEEYLENL